MLGRKVIYVRCISCSYNNVTKGIRLLDKKKQFLFIQEHFNASKSFWKIYPFNRTNIVFYISGTNIALGKPTQQGPYDYCETYNPWRVCRQWESDTCTRCFGSDLAVDGNTNRYFGQGSCAHTNTDTKSTPVSWSVNLEGLYYLLGINVYNSMSIHLVCVRTRVCMCVFV